MIAKISKGKGFGGVLAYVANKNGAEYITGNVSTNPRTAAREMGTLKQYSRCRNPVWHCSLSLSPADRQLSNDDFGELARKFLQKMGLEHNQYTVYRHTDREHAHVHIVANRIDLSPEHKVWNAWQDVTRARKAKAELEAQFNLIAVPHNPQFATPDISRGQREEARRKGVIPSKQYVAEAIASAIQRGNVRDFVQSLRVNGIEAIPNIANTGKMNGFSFRFGKKHYKGSQLKCSWASLKDRIGYDAEKDNDFLYSLLPTEKQPSRAAEPKEPPRRQYCIYSLREWEKMGGEKNSNYRRAYRMINEGYSLRDIAQELKLQSPQLSEKQLRNILLQSGEFWIMNNKNKLSWAYNTRRRSIRFSSDPTIMLIEVLALLISAAIKASIHGIEKHQTAKRINTLSEELESMANYAENKALQREQEYKREREEREERENPLLTHAREMSSERSR